MKYLVGLSVFLAAVATANAADVAWEKDAKTAFAEAKTKNELVMVYFELAGDPWCKKFDEAGLKDPRFAEDSKRLVPLKVSFTPITTPKLAQGKPDPNKVGKELCAQFGVAGFPTVLFVKPDQTVLVRLAGYYTAGEFNESAEIAMEIPKALPAAKAKLAISPNDGEANARMATYLCAMQDPYKAQEPAGAAYLTKALASSYRGPYLVRALLQNGALYSQVDGKESLALEDYKKALEYSHDPAQLSTALVGLVYLNRDKDKVAERKYAEQLLALKGATPDWVEVAKTALAELNGKQ